MCDITNMKILTSMFFVILLVRVYLGDEWIQEFWYSNYFVAQQVKYNILPVTKAGVRDLKGCACGLSQQEPWCLDVCTNC